MKVSELIAELQAKQDLLGDVDVTFYASGCGYSGDPLIREAIALRGGATVAIELELS